jgi:hypothetical protein
VFSTRLVWCGKGDGRWNVELSQIVDGRAVLLATVPLGDWAKLGATQQAILDAIEAGTTVKDLVAAR